jgi:hypothetical protein
MSSAVGGETVLEPALRVFRLALQYYRLHSVTTHSISLVVLREFAVQCGCCALERTAEDDLAYYRWHTCDISATMPTNYHML